MCIYNCSLWQAGIRSFSGVLSNLAHELSGRIEVLVVVDAQFFFLSRDKSLGDVAVSSLQSQNHGLGELVSFVSVNNRLCQFVAAEDTSEDVNKNSLHFGIII